MLWSKESVIFTLGCIFVINEIIPQMADEPLTPVLQFFSERRNFSLWIALLNLMKAFLDFFVHRIVKIIPVSMILVNTLRLPRTKQESQA